jgi:cytoplasmic iron level regulating protein YaaA (DUF328/UPF0246 family)
VLILLPPSEGKTPATSGSPVDPASLWLPSLATARTRVLGRLVAMCRRTSARSIADSLAVLGLSEGQRGEIARNAELREAPAAPASEVYTGVLYEALGVRDLDEPAAAWLGERAVVFSGLWGVVRLGDRIPAYRCPVGVTLPAPVGGLTAYWKKVLKSALDQACAGTPVLDLRSGAYAAMWTPGPEAAALRVLHERVVDGVARRSVVSHFNKATKGRIVRALLEHGGNPRTPGALADLLVALGWKVEVGTPNRKGTQLDVVVSDI